MEPLFLFDESFDLVTVCYPLILKYNFSLIQLPRTIIKHGSITIYNVIAISRRNLKLVT